MSANVNFWLMWFNLLAAIFCVVMARISGGRMAYFFTASVGWDLGVAAWCLCDWLRLRGAA